MYRKLLATLALTAALGSAVLAQTPAMVYVGSFTPFGFRVSAGGKDAQARADHAMNVVAKYLGGKAPKVTPVADKSGSIRLVVNKETLATVTPADAKAEKAKNVKLLAATWTSRLNKAFKESSAQK